MYRKICLKISVLKQKESINFGLMALEGSKEIPHFIKLFSLQQLTQVLFQYLSSSVNIFELEIDHIFDAEVEGQIKQDLMQVCALLLAKHSRFLTTFNVVHSNLMVQHLRLLLRADWQFLVQINLQNNRLTYDVMKQISSHSFNYLRFLNVSANPIGNKGVSYFCQAKLPRLEDINLSDTSVTAEGIAFLERHCFKSLRHFFYYDSIRNINELRLLMFVKAQRIMAVNCVSKQNQVQYFSRCSYLLFMNEVAKIKENFAHYSQEASQNRIKQICRKRSWYF